MAWTERQRAMLQAMGLRLWLPEGIEPVTDLAVDEPPPEGSTAMPEQPSRRAAAAAPAVAVAGAGAGAVTAAGALVPPGSPPLRPATPPAAAPRVVSFAPDESPVARLDWPALRAAVADCRACTLCESRTQTVFGVGHERAHWMIVGEAPGENEDKQGEPFVGAAGRLLDRMLLALGLTRGEADAAKQVYIANTLKCRPPRNRNPEPEELARCQPFLLRQVELVQPRVILAMGRFAVQSLLDSTEPIGRLRGRVHTWRGRPLVVTYHPAYLLRNPPDKAKAWADLCLAAQAAGAAGPGSGAPGQ
jgi:uracil-DNA glycosylase family 4